MRHLRRTKWNLYDEGSLLGECLSSALRPESNRLGCPTIRLRNSVLKSAKSSIAVPKPDGNDGVHHLAGRDGTVSNLLDLHGGAWNAKDRKAEEPMDRAIAESGVVVVAELDLTLAPESPYPACVLDANLCVRWLKTKAASWNGNPAKIGVYGSSSGGHVAELLAMRPQDSRYNAIPLQEAPRADASVAYVAMRSPISNTFARYQNAEKLKRTGMIRNNTTFFVPWETIHESNPQEILDRHETITKVPFLIMQGALDDNILPVVQERFAQTYRDAGGDVEYELFEGCEHEWVAQPGPQTDRARQMVKAFIARQVNAS